MRRRDIQPDQPNRTLTSIFRHAPGSCHLISPKKHISFFSLGSIPDSKKLLALSVNHLVIDIFLTTTRPTSIPHVLTLPALFLASGHSRAVPSCLRNHRPLESCMRMKFPRNDVTANPSHKCSLRKVVYSIKFEPEKRLSIARQ